MPRAVHRPGRIPKTAPVTLVAQSGGRGTQSPVAFFERDHTVCTWLPRKTGRKLTDGASLSPGMVKLRGRKGKMKSQFLEASRLPRSHLARILLALRPDLDIEHDAPLSKQAYITHLTQLAQLQKASRVVPRVKSSSELGVTYAAISILCDFVGIG